MHRRRITLALISAPALVAAALAAPQTASARPAAKAIPHTAPSWQAHAKAVGHTSKHAAVTARVYLAPRGGTAALDAAVRAVSTPGNANYRHFLTTAQYKHTFGPTNTAVQAVEKWVRSAGLKVTSVESQHRYVAVSGSVAAAEKAFGSTINTYRHNGQTVQAPAATLSAPAAVASQILTVTGLDTTVRKASPASKFQPPAGFRNARPCSAYYGQITAKYQADYSTPLPKYHQKYLSYAPCGYTGPQFRAAYEGNSSLDGSGVTVAITDAFASPTIASDAERYATNHGDGSYAAGQFTQVQAKPFRYVDACGGSGWWGEETLDVEAVHAMAPGANIRYYGARSCYDVDLLDTLATVVDENKAQLVTNSWSDFEQNETAPNIAAYEQVFQQGALQGISFMFSSGDDGDELAATGLKQVDYPASDPYVTGVGGTSAAIAADGSMTFQTGWGTQKYALSEDGKTWVDQGFLYGAGGGYSGLFNKPFYQQGVTPGAARGVPDVAMDADPNTGMLIGQTQAFSDGVYYDEYRLGGTSLASPLFAGMTALTLQNSGSAAGLLNPAIYANATSGVFTDVKGKHANTGVVRVDFANSQDSSDGLVYSIRAFNQDSSLQVAAGWDDVTGVGAPNSGWLAAFGSSGSGSGSSHTAGNGGGQVHHGGPH
jgi:subtilase family serine protease